MNATTLTLEEIRRRGIEALAAELGPVGMVRFLQQFETGRGDYSQDRDAWLTGDVNAIVAEIEAKRKAT